MSAASEAATRAAIGRVLDALIERYGSLEAAAPYLAAYVAQKGASE